MKTSGKFSDQSRWDRKGKDLIEEIQGNPANFIVDGSCYLPHGSSLPGPRSRSVRFYSLTQRYSPKYSASGSFP